MFGKLILILSGSCLVAASYAANLDPYLPKTEAAYQVAKQSKHQLKRWSNNLPKGGDLHNHFVGAIYIPQLIKLFDNDATQPAFCMDMTTDTVHLDVQCMKDNGTWLRNIATNSSDYNEIVSAWTMKGFQYSAPNFGEDHFFDTFAKVGDLAADRNYYPTLLADMMKQAAKEHLNYIEYMITMDGHDGDQSAAHMGEQFLARFDSLKTINQQQATKAADLLIRKGLYSAVVLPRIIQPTERMVADAKQLLHCDGSSNQAKACEVAVRFQYQIARVTSPSEVFADMVAGELAHHYAPNLYVTENLVAPESSDPAIKYYHLQMEMLKTVNQYAIDHFGQRMKLAEHAGELTAHDTDNSNLQDHIYQAVNIAGADRIGHGVDIDRELKSHPNLLTQLAKRHTMIEVNLTSNQDILGVCDGQSFCESDGDSKNSYHHPLMMYNKHHVPVALSTDDEGVSNTSLNHEYYMAMNRYPLTYSQIKNIDRNSLQYAFVEGSALWIDDTYQQLAKPCNGDNPYTQQSPSSRCERFLQSNTKARLQWRLEQQFADFERAM